MMAVTADNMETNYNNSNFLGHSVTEYYKSKSLIIVYLAVELRAFLYNIPHLFLSSLYT